MLASRLSDESRAAAWARHNCRFNQNIAPSQRGLTNRSASTSVPELPGAHRYTAPVIAEFDESAMKMDRYVQRAVMDMREGRDELTAAIAAVGPNDWNRYVPYGSRTLHDLLAHLATADQVWAVAAKGLLKGESEEQRSLTPPDTRAVSRRAMDRARIQTPEALIEEMQRRRNLLLSLYELLEGRHLALALRSFGDEHNSVRERIWRGYHDRLHAADIRRALRMRWHPPRLKLVQEILPSAEGLSPNETLYVAFSVDPVNWERPSPVSAWTYRQLLAHIATGDWVLQTHLRHIVESGTVARWPDIDAGNARLIEERRFSTHGALIEEYLSMRHETLTLLAQLKPKHLRLTLEFWWEPRPNQHTVLEYLAGFEGHDRHHREQLRRAMKYLR
jgi:Mycothiol maleylpyruvate isomerase N-terminal domain/DinB superfamily